VSACDQPRCVTCADEAVPMRVQRVDTERGLALCVGDDGGRQTVETALVEPVGIGDRVLVHAGVALVAEPA
jgi:hydrogenase maturation factor